jgi:hypothetical protein
MGPARVTRRQWGPAIVVATALGCGACTMRQRADPPLHPCPVAAQDVATYEGVQAVCAEIQRGLRADFDAGLASLREHEACGYPDLTIQLHALVWRLGPLEADPGLRRRYASVLVAGSESDHGAVASTALRFLLDFDAEDLDAPSRRRLIERRIDDEHGVALLRLIGRFELAERREELIEIAGPPTASHRAQSQGWTALLALARMGDEAALARVLDGVRREDDTVTRSTLLFADLAFTRQPAAFDLLREFLHSEERLPPLKDTGPGSLEALDAARQFALHAVGCPVQGEDVSTSDIPTVRAWADAQTRWTPR